MKAQVLFSLMIKLASADLPIFVASIKGVGGKGSLAGVRKNMASGVAVM